MAYPYFPHVTRVTVEVRIEGHQMERISESMTLTKEVHGVAMCRELADCVLSAIGLVSAKHPPQASGEE
jgi:hypothetical protein